MRELQDLLNYLMNKHRLSEHIELKKGRGRSSRASRRFSKRRREVVFSITISRLALVRSIEYQYAILIHEFCHHLVGLWQGHNKTFRRKEIEIMGEFGMVPKEYKRAYWKRLEYANGDTIKF